MFKAVFNFSDFRGRADRGEFWSFLIFAFLAGLIGMMIMGSVPLASASGQSAAGRLWGAEMPGGFRPLPILLTILPVLVLLVPATSVTIRRLRDAGIPLVFAALALPLLAANILHLAFGDAGFVSDMTFAGYVCAGILLVLALVPSKQTAEAPRHAYTQKRIRLAENDTVAHVPVFDFTSPPASDENDRQGFGRRR